MADQDNLEYLKKLKGLLGKASQATLGFGADVETPEAIEPTGSPIDLAAGGLGAKLGGAMARDAGSVVGNEVGSLGPNLKQALGTEKFAPLAEGESPGIIQNFQSLLGKGEMSTPDMLTNAQNIHQRAIQLGQKSPITPDLMTALQQRLSREASQKEVYDKAIAEAKKKALANIVSK